MDTRKFTISIASVLIFVLLGGLLGWYWYLRTQTTSIEGEATSRGFGSSIPSFSGSGGSTLENIISGLGFQDEPKEVESTKAPRLWRVLATPAAGLGFVGGATSTTLRMLERSTGYLFQTDVLNGKTVRLTNTLVGGMYRAHFSPAGSPVVEMLKDDALNVSAFSIQGTTTQEASAQLVERPLGSGVRRVAMHPKKPEMLSLVRDGAGTAIINSLLDGTKPSKLFSSALSDWNIIALGDDTVVLAQPPASGVPGNAYRLANGALSPLVRSVPGLTILPKTGSDTLLIGADSGGVILTVRASAGSTTVPLLIRTIADKCVWAPGAQPVAYCAVPRTITSEHFIDDWYRGLVHTEDTWWKIDASVGTAEEFFTPDSATSLDVERPVINDAGEYIAFMNAYDKSVWVLRILE